MTNPFEFNSTPTSSASAASRASLASGRQHDHVEDLLFTCRSTIDSDQTIGFLASSSLFRQRVLEHILYSACRPPRSLYSSNPLPPTARRSMQRSRMHIAVMSCPTIAFYRLHAAVGRAKLIESEMPRIPHRLYESELLFAVLERLPFSLHSRRAGFSFQPGTPPVWPIQQRFGQKCPGLDFFDHQGRRLRLFFSSGAVFNRPDIFLTSFQNRYFSSGRVSDGRSFSNGRAMRAGGASGAVRIRGPSPHSTPRTRTRESQTNGKYHSPRAITIAPASISTILSFCSKSIASPPGRSSRKRHTFCPGRAGGSWALSIVKTEGMPCAKCLYMALRFPIPGVEYVNGHGRAFFRA